MKNIDESFHDYILDEIKFNWKEKNISITLKGFDDDYELVVQEFTSAIIPRHDPWGPSDMVNEISIEQKTQTLVQVEMQSGDVLKIEAQNVSIFRLKN